MKKLILLFALLLSVGASAQRVKTQAERQNAAAATIGAVPVKNGMVVFEKTLPLGANTPAQAYDKMVAFVGTLIANSKDENVSRITMNESAEYSLAASLCEEMYFKRRAWTSDFTDFLYQLLVKVDQNGVHLTMQRIHYLYDAELNAKNAALDAEGFITDDAAFRKGKLRKENGKFRKATIARAEAIFTAAQGAL